MTPSPVANFIIELVVENIGSTLARDVSFKFNPSLQSSLNDSELEESFLVRQGIPTMAPGMRLARIFDSAIQRQEAGDLPWRFNVEVQFSDYRGRDRTRSGTCSTSNRTEAARSLKSVAFTTLLGRSRRFETSSRLRHAGRGSECRCMTRTTRAGLTVGNGSAVAAHRRSATRGQLAADRLPNSDT
jgi:hypothetical protein